MDKYDKLWKWLKENSLDKYSGSHSIHTPRNITTEIVSKIDTNDKSVLVLFNVEFVLSLLEKGVNANKICFLSDHNHKTILMEKIGVKYIMKDTNTTKKFDVVLLNPPYDRTTTDSREREFYMNFVRKAFSIGNVVAGVYPARWTSLNNAIYKKFNKDLLDSGLMYFKWLPTNTFPGVQMITCYTISEKGNTQNTIIEDNTGATGQFDVKTLGFYPSKISQVSLLSKLSTDKSISHRAKAGSLYENGMVKGPHPIVFRAGKAADDIPYYYGSTESQKKTALVGKHKVIVSRNGAERKLGPVKICIPDAGVGFACFGLETSSKEESINLKNYLELKTIKFIVNQYKRGTKGNSKELFNKIPEVDFKKSWTDNDLFDLFSLTAEEQKVINDFF